jgi:hypothetical protein
LELAPNGDSSTAATLTADAEAAEVRDEPGQGQPPAAERPIPLDFYIVDYDEVPEWLLDAIRDAEEHARATAPLLPLLARAREVLDAAQWVTPLSSQMVEQAQTAVKMYESAAPLIEKFRANERQTQQVLDIARSLAPLTRYVQHAQQSLAMAADLAAYADQLSLATDAGLAQIAELAARPAEPVDVTGVFHAVLPAVKMTAYAEVAATTDRLDVKVEEEAPADAKPIDVPALAVILVWLIALSLPAAQAHLSPEAQQVINTYIGTISLALIITWRINDNRKH